MILRLGDKGNDVARVQRQLAQIGFPVEETHIYDAATQAAVTLAQRANRLDADGIVGPRTWAALSGEKHARALQDADFIVAAKTLAVSVPTIRAVTEVESRGKGFLSDERPVILFERHIFYRRLKARGIDPEPFLAQSPNVVSPSPGGYQGGAAEYKRLASATSIDKDAAHESASWGAFQVMGFHWKLLGYPSVEDFVAAMHEHERTHLNAFVRFISADTRMHTALADKQWAVFARLYNGPNYARNLYDVKLARAYEKHARQEIAQA